jgi:hypothetical protein
MADTEGGGCPLVLAEKASRGLEQILRGLADVLGLPLLVTDEGGAPGLSGSIREEQKAAIRFPGRRTWVE